MKTISSADQITGNWITKWVNEKFNLFCQKQNFDFQLKKLLSDNITPVKYSLTLFLTWLTSIKTTSDLQSFGDVYVSRSYTVLTSVPSGYSATINQSLIQITGKFRKFKQILKKFNKYSKFFFGRNQFNFLFTHFVIQLPVIWSAAEMFFITFMAF